MTEHPSTPVDCALARRLEAHETWSASSQANATAHWFPATGAANLALVSGVAVYGGPRSPNTGVFGWGMAESELSHDLRELEDFYRQHGARSVIRHCPLANEEMLPLLGRHGYVARDDMNVYVQPIGADGDGPSIETELIIRPAKSDEARRWFVDMGYGGDWADPDGIEFMMIRCGLKPDSRLFLAWLGSEPVGGGGLETHDGVAALMAAVTAPAYRGRGVHKALVRARLKAARESGCDLAMVHTRPGAPSQRNVLRSGFRHVYTVTTYVASAGMVTG